jgi:hypothetical protein
LGQPSSTGCSGGPCYGVVYNFFGGSINQADIGIQYGSYVQGVNIQGLNDTGEQIGVYVPASQTGVLAELNIGGGSQFNCFTSDVQILTTMQQSSIVGDTFFVNSSASGIDYQADLFSFEGSTFVGSTGTPASNNAIVLGGSSATNIG